MKLVDFISNRNWKIKSIDQTEKSEYFFPEFVPCELRIDEYCMFFIKIDTQDGFKEIVLNFSATLDNCKDQYLEGILDDKVGFYFREKDGKKEMKIYQHKFGNFQIEETFE